MGGGGNTYPIVLSRGLDRVFEWTVADAMGFFSGLRVLGSLGVDVDASRDVL